MTRALIRPAWYDGLVPTGANFAAIDASISGALNGDGGGNGTPWTPSAAILIGGAGMWAAGPWTLGAANIVSCGTGTTNPAVQQITSIVNSSGQIKVTVSGPFGPGSYSDGDLVVIAGVLGTVEANGPWQIGSVSGGNTFVLEGSTFVNAYVSGGTVTEVQSQITFGDNDYFVLGSGHSAMSRTIVTPVGAAQAIQTLWSTNPVTTAGAPVYGLASLVKGASVDVPLRVHHGAGIVSATLTFFVGQNHAGVPAVLPGVRLVAVAMNGAVVPLATTARTAGTDATGMQFVATPASGSAWYDSGDVQTFTYTCDAGAFIDTTQYTYHAIIQDEVDANAMTGNIYVELELSFTGIADQRPQ